MDVDARNKRQHQSALGMVISEKAKKKTPVQFSSQRMSEAGRAWEKKAKSGGQPSRSVSCFWRAIAPFLGVPAQGGNQNGARPPTPAAVQPLG